MHRCYNYESIYEDVDLPSSDYTRRNESPQMNWNSRNSFSNPIDYYRNREHVSTKNLPNYFKPHNQFNEHAENRFAFQLPQQYNNFHPYPFLGQDLVSRNYHSQQNVFSFLPRLPIFNVASQNLQQGSSNSSHPIYKTPELYLNKNFKKDSKETSQVNQESVKREALAAELKKSLLNLKKKHSQNRDPLLILDKSKESDTSSSTSQYQPCFPWDLPLTVDDLKSIGRGKTGNISEVCADSCNESELFSLERQLTTQDKERTEEPSVNSPPEVQFIKQCRKRQRSESIEVVSKKPKLNNCRIRRRHHSASANLCEEIIPEDISESIHSSQGNLSTHVSNDDGNLTRIANVNEHPKPNPSSTLMQLLGVKRRELSEMVEQPRNPRVQFMLSLLMKRHKEFLGQRAIRSRFSTLQKEFTPNCKTSKSEINDNNTEMQKITNTSLEGFGASDTLDFLSNILLKSSLTVDISSLPQELINQLGNYLEMGVDFENLSEEMSSNEESNPNASGKTVEIANEPISEIGNTCTIDDTFKKKETEQEKELSNNSQINTERKEKIEQDKHSTSNVQIGSSSHSGRIKGNNLKGERKQFLSKKSGISSRDERRNKLNSVSSNTSCTKIVMELNNNNIMTDDVQEVIIDRSSSTVVPTNYMKENKTESVKDDDVVLARMWEIDQRIKELMDEKEQLYEKIQRSRLNVAKSPERKLTLKKTEDCLNLAASMSSSAIKDSSSNSVIPLVTSPLCSSIISEHSSVSNGNKSTPQTKCTQSKTVVKQSEQLNAKQVISNKLNSNGLFVASTADCSSSCLDLTNSNDTSVNADLTVEYDSTDNQQKFNRPLCEYTGLEKAVLAIMVREKFLYAACADLKVYCYDWQKNELKRTFSGHRKTITCIYLHIRKGWIDLFSGSHDKQLLKFNAKNGNLLRRKGIKHPIQCMEEGWGALFIGTKVGTIERYIIETSELCETSLAILQNEIMAIQTNREGPRKVLIVATRDKPIFVCDAFSGLLLRAINVDIAKHNVFTICVYKGIVYAGTSIYGLTAWNFTNGKYVQRYEECGTIVSMKIENSKIYAASYDGNVYIYDIGNSKPIHIIRATDKMLLCMDICKNLIFAGSLDGKLRYWAKP